MIEILAIISFLAIAGYGVLVAWPHVRWSAMTSRQPGGLRRQYSRAQPVRVTRQAAPAPHAATSRDTTATAGLYSRRSEELIRRGASARDALARDIAGYGRTPTESD